jgi:hypothetical protein
LVLNYAERSAHPGFFRPLLQKLQAAQPGDNLPQAFRRYLDSPAINQRTDDDKTLMLALRDCPT